MPRYEFLWRRRDVERSSGEGGWRSKTIRAESDAQAAERMLEHCYGLGRPVEIDYEMARLDEPYNPDQHDRTFWNMEKAGVQLETN